MNSKTVRIIYWVLTIIFVLMMLMDGGAGVAREQTGQEVMKHLGYPVYAMVIFGIAKILGAFAILQNKYVVVKEWAFAGFIINALGAFASRLFVGDGVGLLIPPLVMLAVIFTLYYFWKKYQQIKAVK